jgi:hypothetical protein
MPVVSITRSTVPPAHRLRVMVRSRRLELPRPFGHSDLNAARLPVPPRPHVHEDGRQVSRRSWQGGRLYQSDLSGAMPGLGSRIGTMLNRSFTNWLAARYTGANAPASTHCRDRGRQRALCAATTSRQSGHGNRPHCVGGTDHAGRDASRCTCPRCCRHWRGRHSGKGPARRISLKGQPFRLRVTVEPMPLGGTSISALLKVAVPPGGSVRAGGAIVQE